MHNAMKKSGWWSALLAIALVALVLPTKSFTQDQPQDQQDDPPTRVARLGYMEGSVSLQPAGEDEWVEAVPNRPLTTGDQLWADRDSRAELQLGSATIRLAANTGFSFLNLDDNTVQIQLTAGKLNIRVRELDPNDTFEIDTPNLAFSIAQPGSYQVESSQDGTYTVVGIRAGGGEATGNGQTYTLRAGLRATFSGTSSLNADLEPLPDPGPFDNWAYQRDLRIDESRSAQYCSRDVVGYQDLDAYGDWRDDPSYGHVWYPNQVGPGWAPYHEGHWDWIAPWGYTWVDDSPWGYAPFHYGRWAFVGGRWGWIAGPIAVRPVYAPALVVFIGGGPGGFGGNVGWFPLGPREVYVPSYPVSRAYVQQVNVSNTTVNVTQVTNVYNTTIINRTTTNITNVTYVNRTVQGAVTAVPQRAFAGAQPVGRAAVTMSARDIAAAPLSSRAAIVPTRESVLGAHAATANHVTAPPAAVMSRQVIAKKTPPPPPVSFAAQQQAMAAHPGQPLGKREVQALRPAAAAAQPRVKQAPPGKPATATTGRPANPPNQPANQPSAARPAPPAAAAPASPPAKPAQPALTPNQPINRPGNPPAAERPGAAVPPARPNQPPAKADHPPAAQPNRPPAAQLAQPAPNNRPPAAQPNNRPEPNRPAPTPPEPNRPQPAPRQQTPPPQADRPPQRTTPPPAAKPASPQREQPKPQTPEEKEKEKKREQEQKPPGE